MPLPVSFRLPWRHVGCTFVLIAGSACSGDVRSNSAEEARLQGHEELIRYLSTPQYGPQRPVSGFLHVAPETFSLGLCDDDSDSCRVHKNVDGSEQSCWANLTEAGSASLEKLHPHLGEGRYWIEGEARIAVRPGQFGHLGEYTCQVELIHVRVFEKAPRLLPPMER